MLRVFNYVTRFLCFQKILSALATIQSGQVVDILSDV